MRQVQVQAHVQRGLHPYHKQMSLRPTKTVLMLPDTDEARTAEVVTVPVPHEHGPLPVPAP